MHRNCHRSIKITMMKHNGNMIEGVMNEHQKLLTVGLKSYTVNNIMHRNCHRSIKINKLHLHFYAFKNNITFHRKLLLQTLFGWPKTKTWCAVNNLFLSFLFAMVTILNLSCRWAANSLFHLIRYGYIFAYIQYLHAKKVVTQNKAS